MTQDPLVPDDFDVPRALRSARFRLEPLGPQHNVADLNAWTTSVDLVRHADEFDRRVAFAYTVLRPEDDDVIGCLYLDPGPRPGSVDVRSWVRADTADLDPVLRREVRQWLTELWPFDEVVYAG